MYKFRLARLLRGTIAVALLAALCSPLGTPGWAQAAGGTWLGDLELITDAQPNADLRETAHGAATFAYAFASVTGGVNFQCEVVAGVAAAPPTSAEYDSNMADGHRLKIKMGETVFSPVVYDWELRPIVLYADSSYTAVVSLFGDGPDTEHYFYIRYHPALRV